MRNRKELKVQVRKINPTFGRDCGVSILARTRVNIGILLLAIISVSSVGRGQTKTTNTDPVKQEPQVTSGGVPAGPSGIFTIYDGSTIRRGELTFSIAYSSYDRDPGILDTSKTALSSGAIPRLGQPFKAVSEVWGGHIEAIDCSPQQSGLIPSGFLFKDFRLSKRTWQRPIGFYGGIIDIKADRVFGLAGAESNNTDEPRLDRGPMLVTENGNGGFLIICSDGASRLSQGDISEVNQVRATYGATSSNLLETENLIQQGRSLEASDSPAARREAILKYQEALSGLRNTNDPRVADLYRSIGNIHYALGEYSETLTNYGRALELDKGDARTLMNMGITYRSTGDSVNALEFLKRALTAKNVTGAAQDPLLLYNIGLANLDLGENSAAIDYFNLARYISPHSQSQPSASNMESTILNGLGSAYFSSGNSTEAIACYSKALDGFKRSGDLVSESATLRNLGKLNNDLGDYEQALSYLFKALSIVEKLSNKQLHASISLDIGNTYLNQRTFIKSREFYEEALSIFKSIGDRVGESITLNALGRVRMLTNDFAAAPAIYESALALAGANEDRQVMAATLSNIGMMYKVRGDLQKARECYEEALELSISLKDLRSQAQNLYELALLDRTLGELDQSRSHIESAISIVEELRTNISSRRLRSYYLASIQTYYEEYTDLLVMLHRKRPAEGFDAQAFQASERARARTLLDSIVEGRLSSRGLGTDAKLLAHEELLQEALNRKAAEQVQLLSRSHTTEEAKKIANQIADLSNEYETVRSNILSQSSRYASLRTAQPLDLKEIREQVLDNDTLLLSYVLGDTRSFLFTVDSTSVGVWDLPGRQEIESTALQTYDALRNYYRNRINEGLAGTGKRSLQADNQFEKLNTRLSEMLLGPVANRLGSKKRLLVVAGGALQVIPFASLSIPSSRSGLTASSRVPLIIDHEIVSLPSASTLALLRQATRTRKSPPKTLAIFADGVFSQDDPRLQFAAKAKGLEKNYSFQRLDATREEADAIASLVPSDSKQVFVGFDASRERALNADLKQYRILHFATHGILNTDHPELSGIVLSMYNQNGESENGILRLNEIYNLDLPVELVVLSGCQTALGKEVSGEGLTNITRGFMYAGASRIVASLWSVDDRVTARLMAIFYRKMLSEHLRPAAALRAAQIELFRQSDWKAPYFWASFVFQGDYR